MNISILGCGWLGYPLALHLKKKKHHIKGSTTTDRKLQNLQDQGITPFKILLQPGFSGDDNFLDSQVIIINIPPSRDPVHATTWMTSAISSLLNKIDRFPVKKVIFVSSTSVYPQLNREVFETDATDPDREAGRALLQAEDLLRNDTRVETTILRFGGLIGYDRKPGRFLAGKKNIPNGDAPVNLIHRDDCIEIIDRIIEKDIWGETLNACADKHPVKRDFYTRAARNAGLQVPEFDRSNHTAYKRVNSGRLKELLNFQFRYPDPMEVI